MIYSDIFDEILLLLSCIIVFVKSGPVGVKWCILRHEAIFQYLSIYKTKLVFEFDIEVACQALH